MFLSRPAEVRVFGLLRAQHLQACGLTAWHVTLGWVTSIVKKTWGVSVEALASGCLLGLLAGHKTCYTVEKYRVIDTIMLAAESQ